MARKDQDIKAYVLYRLDWMKENSGTGHVKGTLANLRRGVGKEPGEIAEIWGIFLEKLPDYLKGQGDTPPTREEKAVYNALTLFALHQQGKGDEWMHQEGVSLGKAARRLVNPEDEDSEVRITKRLQNIASASSSKILIRRLSSLIQLLSSNRIPLDYGMLTSDLYKFNFPDSRRSVKLKWGRDFNTLQREEREEEPTNE